MSELNWREEVEKRKMDLLLDTQNLLKIKSVLDEEHPTAEAPLGKGVKEALDFMLQLGEKDGFTVKNVDNVAGHIEMGEGEELIGILCHVDVVPEGDGWSSDPFGAEIRNGRIYARGAIDDKGPTMAAYHAMKLVRELGEPLNKRVRMIIGTDEESNWRCVDRYFEVEEMPSIGFAPDADFPIISAEKGIWDFSVIHPADAGNGTNSDVNVIEFSSGRRTNMVPDFATAIVETDKPAEVAANYQDYLQKYSLGGQAVPQKNQVLLEMKGVSAHAMEPNNGKNAGLHLAVFLADLTLDPHAKAYFTFIKDRLFEDSRGNNLGVAYSDEQTGELTINAGVFNYSKQGDSSVGFSMRYPVTFEWEQQKAALEERLAAYNLKVKTNSHSTPHYVDSESFLIKTLQEVYEAETGDKAELLSIGGGTYARSLKEGVAFGPLFPGSEDIAHQKDEYIDIEDMLKATSIYARAIHELAK
ncbi:dipeptidase PepV [Peribacillus frigoritolerans]|uniref:dipeptidase PepV n=1 Tax=Peribacillus frigoritolerans TaxID=450367 RepID=UPI002E2521C6|nr:dipeptidase PepV [Peribacillus frigoritolerans]MED3834672.1 dipeptidase PepV [Peribacillus frigoritolerans]MED3847836.1 dipeptidase PepV [Peribacillus frigoritolerans]